MLGSNYFSRVFADTHDPDILYVAQTSLYRSTDGGKTFEAYVGAPSGDDFHVLWIDPRDSARMILGVDQGAIVSVDAGKTWSSWYNQPTGQFYHVSTDNPFPYRVYGAQQDSGTAGILSRSDYGEILAAGLVFHRRLRVRLHHARSGGTQISSTAAGGTVRWCASIRSPVKIATIFEHGQKYRTAQMPPLAFSPQDPRPSISATQFVLKTSDGGLSWQEISPDLTGYVETEEEEKRRPGQAASAGHHRAGAFSSASR